MVEDRISALESARRDARGPCPRARAHPPGAPARRLGPPAGAPGGRRGPAVHAPALAPPARRRARSPRPAAPAATRPPRDLEDFVGGSVLAWLGGFAVLAGLAFLLTMAISRGWIGEGARTALAGAISLGLFGLGAWLREHRDRTEAALVAAAVGIAGSFGTLVVAGPVYELVPRPVALLGAFVVGAAATAFAVRWRAQVIGWLGLLGALLAPATLGAIDERRHRLPRHRLRGHDRRARLAALDRARGVRLRRHDGPVAVVAVGRDARRRHARARRVRRRSPPRSRSASRRTGAACIRS